MKLSEVKGKRTLETIAAMVDPATRILSDEAVISVLKSAGENTAEIAAKLLPTLLKTHIDDIVEIMAAVNGVSVEDYVDKITVASLSKDFAELLTDKELFDFLS